MKKAASIDFDIDRYLERDSVATRAVASKTLLVLAGVHGNELAGLSRQSSTRGRTWISWQRSQKFSDDV